MFLAGMLLRCWCDFLINVWRLRMAPSSVAIEELASR